MRESRVSGRYANAFVMSLKDENEYNKLKKELSIFKEILDSDETLKSGLYTMYLTKSQKIDVLNLISDKLKLNKKVYNFLLTIIEENRMLLFDSIYELIEDYWYKRQGIEKIKVYSSVDIDDKMNKKIKEKLEKSLNKKVILDISVNPSLIAGIMIERGSIVYDFSINGNLKRLRQKLLEEF